MAIPDHAFHVGELVTLAKHPLRPTAGDVFRILARLPFENGELRYRIQSNAERYQRVATERELSLRIGDPEKAGGVP